METPSSLSPPDPAPMRKHRSVWRGTLLAALAAVCIASAILVRGAHVGGELLPAGSTILLTSIENRTGDRLLDESVAEGLEIDLEQAPRLKLLPQAAYRAAVRQVHAQDGTVAKEVLARRAAQAVGARAYLFGEIRKQSGQYSLNLDLLETESNDRLASVVETAASSADIPTAIDRATAAVRRKTGETASSVAGEAGLLRNGSANLAALDAYAQGERLRSQAQPEQAVRAFAEASNADPNFALPPQRMAWIFAAQHAEIEAKAAALRARKLGASAGGRVRRITAYTGDLLGDGDQAQGVTTIRDYLSAYPESAAGSTDFARAMLLDRHYPEALLAAEKALSQDPTDLDAYHAAQTALLGLNRPQDARNLIDRAEKGGVLLRARTPAIVSIAGSETLSADRKDGTEKTATDFAALQDRAAFFDVTGHWSDGMEEWRQGGKRAQAEPAFASAGASLLSTGALNRALAGRCAEASTLEDAIGELPRGPTAALHLALVSALCRQQVSTQATFERPLGLTVGDASQKFASTLLQAVNQLAQSQSALANATLPRLPYARDEAPLLVYFRAISHRAEQQRGLAEAEFNSLLERPGACFLSGTVVYPLSQEAASKRSPDAESAHLLARF